DAATPRLRQLVENRVQSAVKRPTRKLPARRYCAVSVHGKTPGLPCRLTLEDCSGKLNLSCRTLTEAVRSLCGEVVKVLLRLAPIAVIAALLHPVTAAPSLPDYSATEAAK